MYVIDNKLYYILFYSPVCKIVFARVASLSPHVQTIWPPLLPISSTVSEMHTGWVQASVMLNMDGASRYWRAINGTFWILQPDWKNVKQIKMLPFLEMPRQNDMSKWRKNSGQKRVNDLQHCVILPSVLWNSPELLNIGRTCCVMHLQHTSLAIVFKWQDAFIEIFPEDPWFAGIWRIEMTRDRSAVGVGFILSYPLKGRCWSRNSFAHFSTNSFHCTFIMISMKKYG